MRGTRTLDEEDVAHLDSVDRMREEKEMEVKSGIEREVALFRAARVDRGLARTSVGEDDKVDKEGGGGGEYEHSASKLDEASVKKSATNSIIGSEQGIKKENKAMVPKFTIKKKRKRASPGEESKNDTSDGVDPSNASKITSPEVIAVKECDSGAVDNGDSKCKTSSSDKPASKSGNDSDSEEGGGGILGLGCYGSDSD